MSSDPQHITVEHAGRIGAEATLRVDSEQHRLHADLHVEAGHLPIGTRARLVDAVFDQPAAEPGIQLDVTLPLGDGEILDRLRERCDNLQTRQAGASCLATGTIALP